jgi:membrane protease YdiL (CAAX protease family)
MPEEGPITPDRPAETGIGPLPPAPPSRVGWPSEVRWTALEVLAAGVLYALCPALVYLALLGSGFYERLYGPEAAAIARDPAHAPGDPARKVVLGRMFLWAQTLAYVPQLVLTLALVHAGSGTRPGELGLTTRRLGRNVLAGIVAGVVLVPGVDALHLLIVELYKVLGAPGVQQHSFSTLAQHGLSPSEWALLVLCATVLAPVWEELLFRGLLQPWFATRPWGGHVAMAVAVLYALFSQGEPLLSAVHGGPRALLEAGVPVLVLLALVPVYLLVWWRSRTPVGPALFGTAALFAWVHVSAWPSPVPLLLLGLGLGYLAFRTRSLVGPIVLHCLVNATACVELFVALRRG